MTSYRRLSRRAVSLLFLNSILAIAGCGSPSGRPTGEAISGAVTLDGNPLDRGIIQFKPADPKGLFASADIVDGKYAITSSLGPQPGTYRVEVNSPEGGPIVPSTDPVKAMEQASAPPPKERIPERYNAKSELTAEIKAGGPNSYNFDLKSK